MSAPCDLAIIGAGPAGMAAAVAATEAGLKVVVLDEQPEPGGQIYRGVERLAAQRPRDLEVLGPDYAHGLELVRTFRAAGVDYRPGTQVWQVDQGEKVFYRTPQGAGLLSCKQVLVATGAMERALPVPGWTLPGVLTCGAVQATYKATGLVPDGRIVLAGNGPLLLLLAVQLLRAGVRPAALLETPTDRWSALRHLPGFLTAPGYVSKGIAMLGELKRAGVPYRRGISGLRLLGEGRVAEVEYEWRGAWQREAADCVLLHQGVVPNGNLAWSMRVEHQWDDAQRSFRPQLDDWGRSSHAKILIAGDSGGIIGAQAAEHAGRIAALDAAVTAGCISTAERERRAAPSRARLRRYAAARPFLDALYRPQQDWVTPRDNATVVCRCEEVDAGTIRQLVTEQNCPGPNQMKSFVRCGMGPCQGRLCGLTVVELVAQCRGISPAEVGYYRIRPPIKPVTVGELATLDLNSSS